MLLTWADALGGTMDGFWLCQKGAKSTASGELSGNRTGSGAGMFWLWELVIRLFIGWFDGRPSEEKAFCIDHD